MTDAGTLFAMAKNFKLTPKVKFSTRKVKKASRNRKRGRNL